MTTEEIEEINPEAMILDGLDEAIIGVDFRELRVIYSYDKIIDILRKDMAIDEAIEYFDFNIGCLYIGEMTPIILLEE